MQKSEGTRVKQARRPKLPISNPFGPKGEDKALIQLILHVYRTIFCDVEEALYDIRYPRPAKDIAFMDLEYEDSGCGKHIHKIISDSRSRFSEIIMSQFRELRKMLEMNLVKLMNTGGVSAETFTTLLDKRTELFGIMVPSEDEPLTGDQAFLRDYLVFAAKYREWLAACCVDYSVYQKYVYRRILADVEEYPDVMAPVVEMSAKDKSVLEDLFEEIVEAVKQRRPVDLIAAGIITEEEEDAPRYIPMSAPEPATADIISMAYSLVHWLVKFLIVIRQMQEGTMAVLIRNSLGDSIIQVPRRRGDAHLSVKLLLLTGITVNIDVTSILKTCREDFADMCYKCLYVLLHKGTSEINFITSLEEGQNIVEDGLSYFQRFSELRPLLVKRRGTARSKFLSWCVCFSTNRRRTSLGHHEFRSPIKQKRNKGTRHQQQHANEQRQFYAVGRYSQGEAELNSTSQQQQPQVQQKHQEGTSIRQREVFTLADDFTPKDEDDDGPAVSTRRMSAMSHMQQDELSGKKKKKKKGPRRLFPCSIM